MINPLWLRSFCKLVENKHFTRTAEQLHMTQSGVSQHIRKLEEQLDRVLLMRRGKKFILTDAGQKLYDNGANILLGLSNLEQKVREDCAYSGCVKIMSPGSIGLKLYDKLLKFQKKYPKLILNYHFAPNQKIEEDIAGQDVDLGLVTAFIDQEDLICQPIGKEKLLLVTPASFTLKQPSWHDLKSLGFIDHPDGAHHAHMLMSVNYKEFNHISEIEKKGSSNQIGLILLPVSMGLGFTILPEHAVRYFDKPEHIRVYELPNSVSETVYLIYHRRKELPNRIKTVIAEMKKWL